MQNDLIGEASKCRNKKQDARRKKKIEQQKLEGKSLDIRDWGLEVVPPPPGRREVDETTPSPYPQEIIRNCLVRWNS